MIRTNYRIQSAESILTFPTKVPSDSLGWIGSLKRTSDKSLFPMALGSCGHRITHQLRPINMNGRSILAVTSILLCMSSSFVCPLALSRSPRVLRGRASRSRGHGGAFAPGLARGRASGRARPSDEQAYRSHGVIPVIPGPLVRGRHPQAHSVALYRSRGVGSRRDREAPRAVSLSERDLRCS